MVEGVEWVTIIMFLLLLLFRALHLASIPVTSVALQSTVRVRETKSIVCLSNSQTDLGDSIRSYSYSGSVRPGKVSPQRIVTDPDILLPDYAWSGRPKPQLHMPWMPIVEIKSSQEIDLMRAAGRCAREVLDIAGQAVQPGITTDEIDALVHEETLKVG